MDRPFELEQIDHDDKAICVSLSNRFAEKLGQHLANTLPNDKLVRFFCSRLFLCNDILAGKTRVVDHPDLDVEEIRGNKVIPSPHDHPPLRRAV